MNEVAHYDISILTGRGDGPVRRQTTDSMPEWTYYPEPAASPGPNPEPRVAFDTFLGGEGI
jgi:hypothetical protein